MSAETSPAWALEPVSDLTQIPATNVIALLPTSEAASPIRYRRPLRRSTTSIAGHYITH